MLDDPVVVVLLTVIGGLAGALINVVWQTQKFNTLVKAQKRSGEKTRAITVLRREPAPSGKASWTSKRRAAPTVVTDVNDDDDDNSPTWLDRLRASIDWDGDSSSSHGVRSSALDVDILPNGHTGYNDGFDLSGRHWSQEDGFHNPHRYGNDD